MQTGCLGHGTFGIVIKALDLRSDPPTEVAIKLLPRGDFVSASPLLSCCTEVVIGLPRALTLFLTVKSFCSDGAPLLGCFLLCSTAVTCMLCRCRSKTTSSTCGERFRTRVACDTLLSFHLERYAKDRLHAISPSQEIWHAQLTHSLIPVSSTVSNARHKS